MQALPRLVRLRGRSSCCSRLSKSFLLAIPLGPRPAATTPRLGCLSAALHSCPRSSCPSRPVNDSSCSSPPSPPPTLYGYFPKSLPAGPPPAGPFAIDAALLRREFLALQAANHPDKHPPAHRQRAEGVSAAINAAYRTLATPLPRAQYLLSLRDVDVVAEDHSSRPDANLLATVLDAHETIEQASSDHAALNDLRSQNEARIRASENALDAAFARDDIPAAAHEAVKMRYWASIREAIDAWEEGRSQTMQH
ncbi:hypothetical protein CDD82_3957 [Ophiocordyceps australis]|uniref:Co-chaperone HscB C-terminal oligomerisation domain-containing protein n=1 Tax=Ophiocordyceps australis TaxID=1399860 RepID=A0A2C5Z664_9HYPO|nr:hypothetical protein CDD82_3957 [Ophiocordyceps australis]